MKILPFTIPKPKSDSLIFQEDMGASFYGLLHQHKEIQISYIVSGEGTLIVGDTLNFYRSGDIFILGENLAHVFKSNIAKSSSSHMLSLFFTSEAFGHDFFNIEELKPLRSFFNKAEYGFGISSNKKLVIELFKKIQVASKLDRFILFFELLKVINQSKHISLSAFISSKKYTDNEGRRMSAVYEYTISNFRKPISLETISQEAAMTKNAFCKYFRKRTNKTYITFLNELRIEESCKLMQQPGELSITEIAEMSGFQNISNFNRKFKQIKGKTPSQYRKEISL